MIIDLHQFQLFLLHLNVSIVMHYSPLELNLIDILVFISPQPVIISNVTYVIVFLPPSKYFPNINYLIVKLQHRISVPIVIKYYTTKRIIHVISMNIIIYIIQKTKRNYFIKIIMTICH